MRTNPHLENILTEAVPAAQREPQALTEALAQVVEELGSREGFQLGPVPSVLVSSLTGILKSKTK